MEKAIQEDCGVVVKMDWSNCTISRYSRVSRDNILFTSAHDCVWVEEREGGGRGYCAMTVLSVYSTYHTVRGGFRSQTVFICDCHKYTRKIISLSDELVLTN